MDSWRAIPGFSSYAISPDGEVRTPGGTIMSPWFDKDGYAMVTIISDQGAKRRGRRINRLVLEAFVGPPPTPKHEAAHDNGIRFDNRLENLRWATSAENKQDMARHGTAYRGEGHYRAKLSREDVLSIRARAKNGEKTSALAREFGVLETCISNIKYGRTWKWLKEEG